MRDIKIVRYSGDLYDVLKWAVNRDVRKMPTEFEDWFMAMLPPQCRVNVGHHLNVHTPNTPSDGEWVRGYPHSHTWSVDWPKDTFTCVTFLAMCEEGGEFAIGGQRKNDPYKLWTPQEGDSITFDAMRWHGVKPVKKGIRISLLSSGMPVKTEQGLERGREANFR